MKEQCLKLSLKENKACNICYINYLIEKKQREAILQRFPGDLAHLPNVTPLAHVVPESWSWNVGGHRCPEAEFTVSATGPQHPQAQEPSVPARSSPSQAHQELSGHQCLRNWRADEDQEWLCLTT